MGGGGGGAVKDAEKTRGRWSDEEAKYHINYLELMASIFGLKAFCKQVARHPCPDIFG